MAATKTMGGSSAPRSMSASGGHGTGHRTVRHRRLHLQPGHSALTERIGENTGRKTQRATTDTQYRTSRVREFRTGTGSY